MAFSETASEVPKAMKGVVVSGTNAPVEIRDDLEVPQPAGDQILVQITATSLCMSDLAGIGGYIPNIPSSYCGGHEPVGRVVKIGPSGSKAFKVGDRVGFMPAANMCQSCDSCVSGAHRFCDARINIGFSSMYGGWSEYSLCDPLSTVKIPDGLEDDAAAPLLCAGVTAYGAVKKVALNQPLGTRVNVIGVGGVGHLVVQYAAKLGFDVQAFDVAEDKFKLARECGATTVVNSLDKAAVEAAPKAKTTIVISGAAPAYDLAFNITKKHGKVIAVGVPSAPLPVPLLKMIMEEISLVVTNQGSREELLESLDIAARKRIKPIYVSESINKIQDGIALMGQGKLNGRIVYHFDPRN